MTFMAMRLQNASRMRRARKQFAQQKELMLKKEREKVLGDPAKAQVVHTILENTLYNLMQEVLHSEYDLASAPKQYAFISEGSEG